MRASDYRWDFEDFRRLSQGYHVVLKHLPIDRLDAERHLRLLVDKDELTVLGCEDFKLGISHCGLLTRIMHEGWRV
jgi:hypothetical protein